MIPPRPPQDIPPTLSSETPVAYGVPLARPIVTYGPPPPHCDTHPMLLADMTRGQAAIDIALLMLAIFVTSMLIPVVGSITGLIGEGADMRHANVILTIACGFTLLGAVILMSWRRHENWAPTLGWCVPNWLTWPTALLALAIPYITMMVTAGVTWAFFPDLFKSLQNNPEKIAETIPRLSLPWLILMTLSVGVYEETICRGFLLTRLRRLTGSVPIAILVSSMLFALPHFGSQETITLVPLFVMAVAWASLTWWRRTLIPVIIGHAMLDFLNLATLFYLHPAFE